MPNSSNRDTASRTMLIESAASRADRRASYRDALRNIDWKLIAFCVALWWFIYSAPTEGVFSSSFWSPSSATSSDDF
jgi:hypothetical protein